MQEISLTIKTKYYNIYFNNNIFFLVINLSNLNVTYKLENNKNLKYFNM